MRVTVWGRHDVGSSEEIPRPSSRLGMTGANAYFSGLLADSRMSPATDTARSFNSSTSSRAGGARSRDLSLALASPLIRRRGCGVGVRFFGNVDCVGEIPRPSSRLGMTGANAYFSGLLAEFPGVARHGHGTVIQLEHVIPSRRSAVEGSLAGSRVSANQTPGLRRRRSFLWERGLRRRDPSAVFAARDDRGGAGIILRGSGNAPLRPG